MKTVMLLLITFTFSGFSVPQKRTVTGTVTASEDRSALVGVNVLLKGTTTGTVTDKRGYYTISVPSSGGVLVFSFIGFKTQEVRISTQTTQNVEMHPEVTVVEEELQTGAQKRRPHPYDNSADGRYETPSGIHQPHPLVLDRVTGDVTNREEYEGVEENIFYGAKRKPLSTFSIDVDAASYSNLRRFIQNGQTPPPDAVRIEEMINYFTYDYPQPRDRHPFSITAEIAQSPWSAQHHLVRIGLQGKTIPMENLPPSNLVFLVDVSGSMNAPNKLPLVKKSFRLLVDQLRAIDHVSIVVYAGAAGTLLEPTPGDDKEKIIAALDRLHAGGSTAGGAGLRLAYSLARMHYKPNGNNRVILATDGDFNVGESSNAAMESLIEEKRKEGVSLTVLGFGMGNLKDSKMELLADKGNGNYAYIDNLSEARKVLVSEFGGTLFTIASDVKLQVEFNPARVQAYRLVGYENRKLRDEDFNNDRRDAGDLGSGHTVTALYDIIPVGANSSHYSIDPLKYQPAKSAPAAGNSGDWLTVKLRYKDPGAGKSQLMEHVLSGRSLSPKEMSQDFRWAAAVAAFGMLLKDSPYIDEWRYPDVLALAEASRGEDREGYRSEFLNLVRTHALMARP